eukprot:TRINITY_DN1799_c0_g1_i1.p2 TRINITY_DN1799_c0_g1~~TRINITY_DN1799_c0_g1_i1.p2  ORF type:complete len:125 (+),score=25.90 TRINITY_DN1799_c0_g1_i1:25-375(+)
MLSRLVPSSRAMVASPALRRYAGTTPNSHPPPAKAADASACRQLDAKKPLTSDSSGNSRASDHLPSDTKKADLDLEGRPTMPTTPGHPEFDESDDLEHSKKVILTSKTTTTPSVKD